MESLPEYSIPVEVAQLVRECAHLAGKQFTINIPGELSSYDPVIGNAREASLVMDEHAPAVSGHPFIYHTRSVSPLKNKLRREFDENWEAYEKAWHRQSRYSGPSHYLRLPEWLVIKNRGRRVLPFLVDLLCNARTNWPVVLISIRDISGEYSQAEFARKRALIIESHAQRFSDIRARIDLFHEEKMSLEQTGLYDMEPAKTVPGDILRQQIITDGIDAVPLLLDKFSRDQRSPEVHLDLLKQIYDVHLKQSGTNDSYGPFIDWLTDYAQI